MKRTLPKSPVPRRPQPRPVPPTPDERKPRRAQITVELDDATGEEAGRYWADLLSGGVMPLYGARTCKVLRVQPISTPPPGRDPDCGKYWGD